MASAIHCGLLPCNRIPAYADFDNIAYYDKTSPALIGQPYFVGTDEYQNKVYFMGMWNQRMPLEKVVRSLLTLAHIPDSEYLFQDTFPLLNFSTKCGGFLSKRLDLPFIGRRITVWGIQRQYPYFVDLVYRVKENLK